MSLLLALVLAGTPVGKPCPAPDGGVAYISLGVGTQKVLNIAGPVSGLRVLKPGVIDVKELDAKLLLIIGAGEGATRLEFTDGRGPHSYLVRAGKMEACGLRLTELDALFPCDSTLEYRLVGDRIFLDGEASSAAEWDAALIAVDRYKSVVLLGVLSPEVIEQQFREANAALSGAGFGKARFLRAGDAVLLEGEFPEGEQPKLAALEAHWRPKLERVLTKPKRAGAASDAGR